MVFLLSKSRSTVFTAILSFNLFYLVNGNTHGSLLCDGNTMQIEEKSRTVSCSLVFQNEDSEQGKGLYHMETFTFNGMANDVTTPSIVFTKVKVTLDRFDDDTEEITWMGSTSSTYGLSTLVQGIHGGIGGFVNTETATYSVIQLPAGPIQIRETLWQDTLETDSEESDNIMEGRLVVFDDIEMSSAIKVVRPKLKETTDQFGDGSLIDGNNRNLRAQNRKLQKTNVSVLVVVTNRAMCETAGLTFGCEYTEANYGPIISQQPTKAWKQSVFLCQFLLQRLMCSTVLWTGSLAQTPLTILIIPVLSRDCERNITQISLQ